MITTENKKTDQLSTWELKSEAMRLKDLFLGKGVTHLWDFIQPFYPKLKFDRDAFRLAIYGRTSNEDVVAVLRDVWNRIQ